MGVCLKFEGLLIVLFMERGILWCLWVGSGRHLLGLDEILLSKHGGYLSNLFFFTLYACIKLFSNIGLWIFLSLIICINYYTTEYLKPELLKVR